jgi:hypothetical protein
MHNSLGLRDIEPDGVAKPTILFIGDSQVWGLNIEASERFSDLLRKELPAYRIVNAGVAGYGTDQEYLLLKRIWDSIQPSIVVLIFECNNDRVDNTSNVRYVTYKPYFEVAPDGSLQIRGQPPPKSRKLYFQDSWLGHHSQVARLLISSYIELRHPRRRVSDPTERLVGAICDFVEEKGAKLLVGLQRQEPQLEAFLKAHNVRYTRFDGAAEDHSRHWTPAGNAEVAQRLLNFFSETGISVAGAPSPSNSPP